MKEPLNILLNIELKANELLNELLKLNGENPNPWKNGENPNPLKNGENPNPPNPKPLPNPPRPKPLPNHAAAGNVIITATRNAASAAAQIALIFVNMFSNTPFNL
jgi:hypothetical protein